MFFQALQVAFFGLCLMIPLTGQADSPFEIASVTDQHVRQTDYAGIVEPDEADTLTGMHDWLEAKGVMHAHLSSSGYVVIDFLKLARDGTFQQGTKRGRFVGRTVKARTGSYKVSSENHLLILKDTYEITLKKNGTPQKKYAQTPVTKKERVYHMAYYCRDLQPEHSDAKSLHEELLVLQEILPDGEKGPEITYIRHYVRSP